MENSPVAKLKDALEQLHASENLVERAFSEFESQDLPKENENLRENVRILTQKLENSEKKLSELKNSYAVIEKNFKEELEQKHAAMLSYNDKEMQNYLSMRLEGEAARLNNLKFQVRQKIDRMFSDIQTLESGERDELRGELNIIAEKINTHIENAKKRADDAWAELLADKSKAMADMQNAQIDDAALKAVRNFFNWETFFGLRLISSLGILLIIIGVFTFGRYVYIQMSKEVQCAFIFAIGLIFLIAGEILNKKWRGIFSRALTAGGSGILFLATALGYLTLHVLSMPAALGICAGVSVISFVLAVRHNSQTISIFALIGGYLPMLALESGAGFETIVIWAVIYFTILNLFSLALATRKNWSVSRFIGLFAGLIAETVIIYLSNYAGKYNFDGIYHFDNVDKAVISSVAVAYIAYLIIPVFGAMFTKTKIKPADIVLLSCNVFFRFLIGLFAVYAFNFDKYDAIVPAFFALTCICMALLVERGKHKSIPPTDKGSLRALFFVTSVSFAALIVFFWFDKVWFSSGWLIEGAGLALYGLIKNRRRFIISGSVIGALCFGGFILINVPNYASPLFVWQYLLITLGITAAAVVLAVNKIHKKFQAVELFQFAAVMNLWIYVLYLFQNPLLAYIGGFIEKPTNIIILSCIVFGMLYSFVLPKIKFLYCNGVQIAGVFIGVISILWLFAFNHLSGDIFTDGAEIAVKVLVISLYILTNLIGVFWMRDLLQFLVLKKALPLKFYPLLLSGYFVLAVSHNLVIQLNLRASSMILTFIFGVTALCWIIFGFAKRNNVIRVSGLSLSFFAVVKLFVLDLYDLSTELKIVSYFTMGVLLLAISFIYQYFNKKLKDKKD